MITGLVVALALAAGCARDQVVDNPLRVTAGDRAAVRSAARGVLEDLRFEVEQPPRAPGRLDTLPLVSAYPAEFWRRDVRTGRDRADSALNTVRRTVTVHLRPAEGAPAGDGGTLVEVVVRKERPVLRQALDARSASESYSVFRSRRNMLEDFEEHWGRGLQWTDEGRDPALEAYILSQLSRRF
jgi:hypothetical protein